jgi:hypothetical protein
MQPGAGATVAAFDNASKGIRQPWGIGDITSTLVWEDSTPTSATYGQELGRGQQSYDGLPTTAYWIPGQFAFNQAVTEASDPITGEKYTVWGYKRITSGNANVLNTDWREHPGPANIFTSRFWNGDDQLFAWNSGYCHNGGGNSHSVDNCRSNKSGNWVCAANQYHHRRD